MAVNRDKQIGFVDWKPETSFSFYEKTCLLFMEGMPSFP